MTAAQACTQCRTPYEPGARFCALCAADLRQQRDAAEKAAAEARQQAADRAAQKDAQRAARTAGKRPASAASPGSAPRPAPAAGQTRISPGVLPPPASLPPTVTLGSPPAPPRAPAGPSRHRGRGLLVLGVAVVLAVAAYNAVPHNAVPHTADPTNSSPSAGTGQAVQVDPQQAATAALTARAAADLARTPLNGQWAAQLSTKYDGITDNTLTAANGTHTFHPVDTLAEFQRLQAKVGGAQVILLSSHDYGQRKMIDNQYLWVTFAVASFGSADAVRSWCDAQFAPLTGAELKNACLPAQLQPAG